jgi:hypothetical protein
MARAEGEFDACEFFPCNARGGEVLCEDVEAGARSIQGRVCNCVNGNQYAETSGCEGKRA